MPSDPLDFCLDFLFRQGTPLNGAFLLRSNKYEASIGFINETKRFIISPTLQKGLEAGDLDISVTLVSVYRKQ